MRFNVDTIVQILRERECEKIRVDGDEIWCCCPMPDHDDESPSFSINVEKGLFNCFRCGGGLVSDLLREWGYEPDNLAVRADGKAMHHVSITLKEALSKKPHRKRRHPIRKGKVNKPGRRYLKARGFDASLIGRLESGWGVRTDGHGFGTRLVFPVEDPHGGLAFEVTRSPFKKNWMYSRGAKKSDVLYGLGHVIRDGCESVIVCEGVFDVLRVAMLGFNAVGLLGAIVSDRQVALLSQFDKVVWMLDADPAGRQGTIRNWEKLEGHGVTQYAVDTAPRNDPGEIEDLEDLLRILRATWRPQVTIQSNRVRRLHRA